MASVVHRANVEELYQAKALIACPLRVLAGLLFERRLQLRSLPEILFNSAAMATAEICGYRAVPISP
jgi:hypothetical protein